MKKWEYKVIEQDWKFRGAIEKELNELGSQGWEAVATVTQEASIFFKIILKRPVE